MLILTVRLSPKLHVKNTWTILQPPLQPKLKTATSIKTTLRYLSCEDKPAINKEGTISMHFGRNILQLLNTGV